MKYWSVVPKKSKNDNRPTYLDVNQQKHIDNTTVPQYNYRV